MVPMKGQQLKLSLERSLTCTFLFVICLQLAQSVHNAWFAYEGEISRPVASFFDPPSKPYAPEAYRMAVVAFGRFIVGAFHVHDPTFVAAAFDLVASFFTL